MKRERQRPLCRIYNPRDEVSVMEAMRERANLLEREAIALRAELDEMAIMLNWQAVHAIAPLSLRRIPVSEAEVADYLNFVSAAFEPEVIGCFCNHTKLPHD